MSAIALNPKEKYGYVDRCIANWDLGGYRAGVADCSQAIALDPKDNTAYDNRALNHEKLGETAEAIADYQKVLTIVPSDQYAKDALKRLGASAAAPGGR
jgi:tetratricopeptide (TPR) repeat protein